VLGGDGGGLPVLRVLWPLAANAVDVAPVHRREDVNAGGLEGDGGGGGDTRGVERARAHGSGTVQERDRAGGRAGRGRHHGCQHQGRNSVEGGEREDRGRGGGRPGVE